MSERPQEPASVNVDAFIVTFQPDTPLAPVVIDSLSTGERERMARFRFYRSRQQFAFAHWLLRAKLANAYGCAPSDLRFVADEFGKPRLRDRDAFAFNLSHCDGGVFVALGNCDSLGVDIENHVQRAPSFEVATRKYTVGELRWLSGLPDGEPRARGFFALWTQKESILKADGRGLGIGLRNIDLVADQDDQFLLQAHPALDGREWHLRRGVREQLSWAIACDIVPQLNLRVMRASALLPPPGWN